MNKLSTLLKKVKFCKSFGAKWKDSYRLISLTVRYSLAIRSKSRRLILQSDQTVYGIQVVYNGKNFPLHFRMQDISMLFEVWMDNSYRLNEKIGSDGIIVDIGAHVGFTSLYYWSQLGDHRTYYCIEGSDKNAEVLKLNIKIISKATVSQHIITSDGRQVRFYNEMSGQLHQVHDTLGIVQDSVTMNTLLSKKSLQKIALCKIDIEGMELEILTQHNEWLNTVDELYLELHNFLEYPAIKASLSTKGLSESSSEPIKHFTRRRL